MSCLYINNQYKLLHYHTEPVEGLFRGFLGVSLGLCGDFIYLFISLFFAFLLNFLPSLIMSNLQVGNTNFTLRIVSELQIDHASVIL